jgi:hypothetical protein
MYSNEELKRKYDSNTKISQIISDIESENWNSGSVVCEIHLNGVYLNEDQEKELSFKTLNELNVLEVLVREKSELLEVTLRTIHQWLPKLKAHSLSLNNSLSGKSANISTDEFIQLIEGCRWLSDTLVLLKTPLYQLVKTKEYESDWVQSESFFKYTVQELYNAYEKKDYVLLSDILEYDIPEALDQWHNLLFNQQAIRSLAKI